MAAHKYFIKEKKHAKLYMDIIWMLTLTWKSNSKKYCNLLILFNMICIYMHNYLKSFPLQGLSDCTTNMSATV